MISQQSSTKVIEQSTLASDTIAIPVIFVQKY